MESRVVRVVRIWTTGLDESRAAEYRGSPESVDTLIELIFLSRFFLAAM